MKSSIKPQRIAQADLADATAAGVQRALQARAVCLRELDPQEVAEVSGGASLLLSSAIIAGGRLADILASGGYATPSLPDMGGLGGFGFTGMM